jgi:hypothetical protein
VRVQPGLAGAEAEAVASRHEPHPPLGAYRRRVVTPAIATVFAAPVDLRAGRALEWYPTLAARFEDQRRRARERKALASIAKHGAPGGDAFPFGALA